MIRTLVIVLASILFCSACHVNKSTAVHPATASIQTDSATLFDTARQRLIPITFYHKEKYDATPVRIAIINHGYRVSNTSYSAIAKALARQDYWVISIQHELPDDAPIPSTGPIMEVRKPFWQRGADNILFVINTLKKDHRQFQYDSLVLIGHSNGGDMAMLFAQQYPQLVARVISLDNRRMPFPRTDHPRIYSLRSSDQPADEGVLPTADEQTQYHMRIIKLPDIKHNDMSDAGTEQQQKEIISYILSFVHS